MSKLSSRIGIQQRTLPAYRGPFFDSLAAEFPGGVGVFYGQPARRDGIDQLAELEIAYPEQGKNIHTGVGRHYLYWQIGLARWLQNWQPDALILEINPRNRSIPAAIRWARRNNCALLGWGLGAPAPSGLLSAASNSIRNRLIRQFDVLISYSQKGALEFAQCGFPSDRIVVAPNAVALRPVEPFGEKLVPDHPNHVIVLFVGRLQERKRVDLLLRVCGDLPPDRQPKLWIVGDGPDRSRLEAIARQVYAPARFLGARYDQELKDIYREADLLVMPGTGGLAIQQAFANGLPAIVAEADGTQCDLVRPETGWQITSGSESELRQSLLSALAKPGDLRVKGRNAYNLVRDEFNLESMVAGFKRAIVLAQEVNDAHSRRR